MGKEGKRLKRSSTSASTSTSTDIEAADHKGSVPLQKAEREPPNSEEKLKKKSESKQIDLEPKMKHKKKKKKTSMKIKEMKKLRKSFKEMIAILKNLEYVYGLRADPPGKSLKEILLTKIQEEGVKEEKPREKTQKKKIAKYECNFETEDSKSNSRASLIVYNLDTSLRRDDLKTALRKHFELCGCKVTRVYVPIECRTGVPLGLAFVDVDDVLNALTMASRWMGKRNIIVVSAEHQPDCLSLPNFRGCQRCGIILMKRRTKRRYSTYRSGKNIKHDE